MGLACFRESTVKLKFNPSCDDISKPKINLQLNIIKYTENLDFCLNKFNELKYMI